MRFFLILFLWQGLSIAQDNKDAKQENFSPVLQDWQLGGLLEYPFYWFYIGGPAINGNAYLPNSPPRLGPRFSYKQYGFTITLPLPEPDEERIRRGETDSLNLIFNSYWRRYAYDFYYQSFHGFYVTNPSSELNVNRPTRYPQLPDSTVKNFGLNIYWLASPENYSLRAAFRQREFQHTSGGSWVYNPFYNHLELFLGNEFTLGSDPNAIRTPPNISSGRFDTFGFAYGYGYTFVHEQFFVTGQVTLGPALQYQRLNIDAQGDKHTLGIAAKGTFNGALGWNYPIYTFGFKVLFDALESQAGSSPFSSIVMNAQAFFSGRF